MTLIDLIRSSFRLVGVLHEGQGPNADDITDGLFVLNAMLESWSIERLNVFTIQPHTLNLTATQQAYQWGTGAPDFNLPRPLRIESATAATGAALEMGMKILTPQQWAAIPIKSTKSTIPTACYLDNQFPLANFFVWPVPSITVQVIAYTWQAIQTGFTDTSVTLSFPEGYADAIRYNLACRLAPEWDRPIRPDVERFANEAKAAIKRKNKPTLILGSDVALSAPNGGVWNWITGSTTGY